MTDVKQIISANNKKLLREYNVNIETQPNQPADRKCNCRKKIECPLNGNCLQKSIIYQATVIRKDSNTQETYIGLTDGEFKTRFRNHTASFRNQNLKNSTELSKYIWTLKANNIDFNISWKIISRAKSYSSETKRCNLCLRENFFIICKPHLCSLNRRNEQISTCRHRKKSLLKFN